MLTMPMLLTMVEGAAASEASGLASAPIQGPASLPPPAPLDLRLLHAPRLRAPYFVGPWLAISSEYNDNVLWSSVERAGDVSQVLMGGFNAALQRPRGAVSLGWAGTGRLYAQHDSLHDAFDQETVLLNASWQVRPRAMLSFSNLFLLNSKTGAIAGDGTITGRGRSWSNVFASALTLPHSPRTAWRIGASAGAQHFAARAREILSGRLDARLDRASSRRVTASAGAWLDWLDVGPQGHVLAPGARLGVNWRLLPSWSLSLTGGPELVTGTHRAYVMATGTAVLERPLRHGELRLHYDRSLGVAGEYGGPTANQSLVSWLVTDASRRLVFALVPAYRTYRSSTRIDTNPIDLQVATVDLRLAASISRRLELLGSYGVLRQREARAGEDDRVLVQNRFLLGARLVPGATSLSADGAAAAD